jgi:hypothetical protein
MGRRLLFGRHLGSMVQNQKDMAPPVIPKRKKWNVNQALNANISKINMEADFKMDHI